MANYDLFNGDADGICSLIQLRLAEPKESTLITGIKRHIRLMDRLIAEATLQPGDQITVLDVSMTKNLDALNQALAAGAEVFYADHHQTGDVPEHPLLHAHLHMAANTCTGLIVDQYLQGQYREWAIVAAYGDNMLTVADSYIKRHGMNATQRQQLHDLGIALNYNGYGESLDDLFYNPEYLYKEAVQYPSPFDFISDKPEIFNTLSEGYQADLHKGLAIAPMKQNSHLTMIALPDEPWARRISGVLGNELANRNPHLGHIILTENQASGAESLTYQVSLRSPKARMQGADEIAVKFAGGGRRAAAGIGGLMSAQLSQLWDVAAEAWKEPLARVMHR